MKTFALAALVGTVSAAPSYPFSKSPVYHVIAERGQSSPLASTDIITFDGDWADVSKPASIKATCANGTDIGGAVGFSEQFKTSLTTSEWKSNTTVSIGGTEFDGEAIFFQQGAGTFELLEMLWFPKGSSAGMQTMVWERGPNPRPFPTPHPTPPGPPTPPTPPTPRPTPPPQCQAIYAADACAAGGCSWCASADGAHKLCFAQTSAAKLDTKAWSCGKAAKAPPTATSRRLGGVAAAPAAARNSNSTGAAKCPYSAAGVTYDVSAAHTKQSAATAAECCDACVASVTEPACDHWTFASGSCALFSRAAPGAAGADVFWADATTFSGYGSGHAPPGPPTGPTPAPAPTPAPSPPPAPVAPTPSPEGEKNWAVIVTGSQGYGNYRHHADACHAYQIVRRNGIPKERVILMMQDNVANDAQNPFPGKLFNKPTEKGVEGVDVYDGCFPDYTGKMVDAQLFMDVITGNTTDPTRTKVLASGPKDKVFINFVDHGGGKIVAMPNGPYLTADVLNANIKKMHEKKMYDKLVFYMEACNSGSMWDGLLPDDLNVYVTTAANPTEPSWGTYCPPQDMVNGVAINSCLGDLYSVNWMEDSDTKAGQAERLGDQFIKVRAETNKSHCLEYGTQDFKWTDHASDYQGQLAAEEAETIAAPATAKVPKDAVDSRDIDLVQAFYGYLRAAPGAKSAKAAALAALVRAREAADARFARVFAALPADAALGSADPEAVRVCENDVIATAERACGAFDSYSLKFTQPLQALCREHAHARIAAKLAAVCAQE